MGVDINSEAHSTLLKRKRRFKNELGYYPSSHASLAPVAGRFPEDRTAGEGQLGVVIQQASHDSTFGDVDVPAKLLDVAFACDLKLLRTLLHASRRFLYLLPAPSWQ